MPVPASDFIEEAILEVVLQGKALPAGLPPTKLWLALCEKEVTKKMTGKEVEESGKGEELTYTGYKRTEIKAEEAQWEVTAGGATTPTKFVNKNAISLPLNTGETAHQTAKFYALCEKEKGSEAGKVFFMGKLTAELNITKAVTKLEIAAKALEIECE